MTATDIHSLQTEAKSRRGIFRRVLDVLVTIAETTQQARRLQELTNMSDAQLAERGLRRDSRPFLVPKRRPVLEAKDWPLLGRRVQAQLDKLVQQQDQ